MAENLLQFLKFLGVIAIYLGLGAIVSLIFYNVKKRDLFGGYIGGFVVGVIGAIIGGFVLDSLFRTYIEAIILFLWQVTGANVILGFVGAYAAVYIMNRLNHDRERKKY